MPYGTIIHNLRERRGLTQEELSNRLGISRAALSHYETNRREPDYETLTKIADLFDVSIDYLIGRTHNPNNTLEPEVREFVDELELSDEELLKKYSLTIDGMKLTKDEAKRFIAFIRADRSIR
ncbi:XRE family transcriptional regulator [Paenibacillus swuensis]|uniref:XRE family transcriptional regulator n=1 Tax=Paenibacillus swuensis TaxID=1178515 RepID=A0A172THA4_9BACL|nr:helix-turn-helix transcriptional regulator [Paenibacillus swuensis]ANE46400.1 XRE family transcriptional regulator [Paenibacillus swuensis]